MTCKAHNLGDGYVECQRCGIIDHELAHTCRQEDAPWWMEAILLVLALGALIFGVLSTLVP